MLVLVSHMPLATTATLFQMLSFYNILKLSQGHAKNRIAFLLFFANHRRRTEPITDAAEMFRSSIIIGTDLQSIA